MRIDHNLDPLQASIQIMLGTPESIILKHNVGSVGLGNYTDNFKNP